MLDWIKEIIKDLGGVSDFAELPVRVTGEAAGAVTEALIPQMRRPLRHTMDALARDLDQLEAHLGRA